MQAGRQIDLFFTLDLTVSERNSVFTFDDRKSESKVEI